jgi:two-component system chemotaxis sensor kinase CheA
MTEEVIGNLIEKLSCDFVLADPDEPETLSQLLPVLKQIHVKCVKSGLRDKAGLVLQAKKIIDDILKGGEKSSDSGMTGLKEVISLISAPESKDGSQGSPQGRSEDSTAEEPEPFDADQLENYLKEFSTIVARFCPGEIPDIGAMLNCLDKLIETSDRGNFSAFHDVCTTCKAYVGNMTLEDIENTKPVEETIILLKAFLTHFKKGEPFVFDYSDVLELLTERFRADLQFTASGRNNEKPVDTVAVKSSGRRISDDDMEIMIDFVSEALENLEAIEVNLIELEQDPSNRDIINDIFRPFHTIKGVSGFLSLKKINTLAHITENFLDSARSGDFMINDAATDAILASVDVLKQLIARVEDTVKTGYVKSDDDIDIEAVANHLKELQVSLAAKDKKPLGRILVEKGNISEKILEDALEVQKIYPEKKIGEILVEAKKTEPGKVAAALMAQAGSKARLSSQVKVSTDKLDDLVDYAGELVIAQSMLRQQTGDNPVLSQSVAHLGQIVTNIQNIAMSMRMIPIKATFMKMIRLVRDLAKKSNKKINLEMVGEDTEIDRNMVDALYEPMVHMIRNSCDHGIEYPEDRIASKKPPVGTITLRAYHKGGNIIIEIEDDGRGLDRDAILEKAEQSGLITGNEVLTDAQIYDLILQPGFSTAKTITDISGRGVGMDVVKAGIEKFKGHLAIESEKGAGTRFTISLPLTLAIIDGMLVSVESRKYVIPTIAIQKVFKPCEDECFTISGQGEMVRDRGDLIPVIRISEIYHNTTAGKNLWDSLVVVVESKGGRRALVIDELLGKDEYVIKNLGQGLENIDGVAGGAILADGRVGLILDVHGIFNLIADTD